MITVQTRQKCSHCHTQGVLLSGAVVKTLAGMRVPAACNYCGEIVILKIAGIDNQRLHDPIFINTEIHLDTQTQVTIEGHYPAIEEYEIPQHCPPRIASTFREAIESLNGKKYETSIFLCGKALDISTKSMDTAWSLEKRLKKLAADGKITSDMADWAEEIRLDRNTAAHEDFELTEADAKDAVTFTEAFLTYVYSLPALINSRRANRKPS
ncbi:DUF4145 domain-containing protein [Pseudomonas protegens]|uniref:DUF4145 domain-containing protein n=1 Tax=Pseudomonas protegens TaxID=380021 RepID=UPI001E3C9DAC|nr:DUF4145 domain-containing protein [Pseudomonas protegens]MCD9569472.1 DUF4145 domain-containing protein [Pseudomonas protegens]